MQKILDSINYPCDIKGLDNKQLEDLASEIRDYLIKKISLTGGHLASNLGVVELTLALHCEFDMPEDKIIWDVGHQCYVHKILTGRKDQFDTLRKMGGISGFPKTSESEYDCFNTGHSSTSISAALGFAKARDIKGENNNVIAVIGDGAMTGGMAFEALNDAGHSNTNLIVVLNDNEMSISRNVGGLSLYLSKIRSQPIYFKAKEDIDIILNKIPAIGKGAAKALDKAKGTIKYLTLPGMIFEELGFKYLGPIDGHNISELKSVFSRAKEMKGPKLIHVLTSKGKGYNHAEEKPHVYHGISPFEISTGQSIKVKSEGYSDVFGKNIIKIAEKNEKVVAITAAMPQGTGLEEFSKKFPKRFFDVGIAEQHAVTFAAGMAASGLIPVFAVYSSFLQRAYDQIVHDVALQNLHVVFAIDRSGIVGEDGETHQGIYDISFLSHIPNMTILSPCDYKEFGEMLKYSVLECNGPVAIRYPRGEGKQELVNFEPIIYGKALLVKEGIDITVISDGNMLENVINASEVLNDEGISCEIINIRFIKPFDRELIYKSVKKTNRIICIEDSAMIGGLGNNIINFLYKEKLFVPSKIMGFPDKFIEHGSRKELLIKYGLDVESIANNIMKLKMSPTSIGGHY